MDELILKENKFKEDIVAVVNNSELPAFIMKPILKELFERVCLLEQQQYQQAKESTFMQNEEKESETKVDKITNN